MEDDQFDDDTQDSQRSIVIGAVLLAILVSTVLWYALIFRGGSGDEEELAQTGAGSETIELPVRDFGEVSEPLTDTGVMFSDEGTAEDISAVAGTLDSATPATVDGTPQLSPAPAPITSETGASTLLIAAAVAVGIAGIFGLRLALV